jgi:O-antigen ligase
MTGRDSAMATAFENPVFGVGPKNFSLYCLKLKEARLETALNLSDCGWHAHNLYLGISSEAGLVGLGLFIPLARYCVRLAFRYSLEREWQDNVPIILMFVLFFPIQTYSHAFGQSKNFHFWTMLAFALCLIQLKGKSSRL